MATTDEHRTIAPIVGPDDPRRFTDSGIEIKPLYADSDLPDDLPERLGEPGSYPYTRGIHPDMYRGQLWTMRQYAGYASARESNQRYRYLLAHGSTGLSMAFDLPTQLGLDSDDPRCLGEVGRTGVAIDSIDDMRTAFDEIPLDQVSTSMTINAPAAILLLLYELVGEEQGVPAEQLRGTTQNDILKEYIARGNFIYPPEGAIRLTTDLFAYCNERVPRQADGALRRVDEVAARDVFLEDVVLRRAAKLLRRDPLLLANQLVEQQQHRRGSVDRHRGRDLIEGDPVEGRAHVLDRVDRDARPSDLAERARVVRVQPQLRRQVECHAEAGRSVFQQVAVALV